MGVKKIEKRYRKYGNREKIKKTKEKRENKKK